MRYSLFALLLLAGLTGCGARQGEVLGRAPQPGAVTPVRALTPSASPVTVQGTMVEKCPVSGCWFKLRDRTGEIKVDTKAAGFVVADVPLNTDVTVSGTLQSQPEREISATGLRY